MQVFATVVDLGSFTGAADKLDLSRGAVSKHVADLEQQLGGRLLNRTTRRISLTEAGQVYFARCKQILEDVSTAEMEVGGFSSEPRGELRINAPMSFGQHQLPPLIAEFHKRYPQVNLQLTLSDQLVDVIDEGYDLVLRISQPKDSSLVARRIATSRSVIAASPDYLAEHGTPQHPDDLREHRCLQYQYMMSGQKWVLSDGENEWAVPTSGPLMANNGEMLCGAAIAGMGITWLPTFICCDALRSGELVQILDDYSTEPTGIYLVFPSTRLMSAKVRTFIDFAVEFVGDKPAWDFSQDSVQTY